VPVRSFNAGVAAMVPPEDNYYLDQVLRLPHRRLRWVILEVMPVGAKGDPTLVGTGRYNYWHDWERTRLLTECFFEECAAARQGSDERAARWPEKLQAYERALGVWLENLGLFLENSSNLGQAEELVRRQFGSAKKGGSRKIGEAWDGWSFPVIAKPMTDNEERLGHYRASYEKLMEAKDRFDPGDSISLEALQSKLAKLAKAGVTPIMVIPPTVAPQRYYPFQLAAQAQSPAILDFSDPRKYPEFFTPDHRLDGTHLNYEGAQLYTEDIVRKFVEIVKKATPAR
jgi:hypothetical protein